MLTGTSCRFSERFWAVTTTSSSAVAGWAPDGALAVWAWACATPASMDVANRAAE